MAQVPPPPPPGLYSEPVGPLGPAGLPAAYPPGYPPDRSAQIREWLDVLYRGRWLLLASLAVATAAAVVYALSLPNQYRASTLILVETDPSADLSSVLPESASDAFGGQDRALENELFVLRESDLLAEQTAARLLEMAATPAGRQLTILHDDDGQPLPASAVAARLPFYLAIAPGGREVDAISITATSTVPDEAALIANLYAEAYLNRTRESSRASMTATRDFLSSQVDSLGGELSAREEAVRAYMTREGAVRLDESADRLVTQLADLQAQRDEARISGDMRSAAVAALRRELDDIEPQLADRLAAGTDAEIAAVQEQIRDTQTQIETIYSRNPELRDSRTPPAELATRLRRVETLRQRARELAQQALRDALATGGVSASTAGVERLVELRRRMIDQQIEQSGFEAQESTITARMAAYESELSRIPTQAVELARLTRDRQSTEGLAVALQERLQEARVAEQSELGYAEVVSRAETPALPVAPNRRRIVMLGVLFGLGLGIGLALVRTRLDHRIRKPDDLRARGLTVLGVVPDFDDLLKQDFDGAKTIALGGRQVETQLVTLLSPMSQAAEAYRTLRTSVQFSRPDTVVQTLVVTSATPGEGKTTTASNLAVTLAQAGRRVLLVDADLRRPRQHSLYGVPKRPGLSDGLFAVDQTPPSGDSLYLQDGVFDVPSPEFGRDRFAAAAPPREIADDLWLQPAGRAVPNPSEVLGSRTMREQIARWRDTYDIIVFDAPPVLAATDAVLLSTQADAVIVVSRSGKTHEFELERALEALRNVGAPIIGMVLNGFDASHAYGYKYRYTYGYKQTYSYGHDAAQAEAEQDEASVPGAA